MSPASLENAEVQKALDKIGANKPEALKKQDTVAAATVDTETVTKLEESATSSDTPAMDWDSLDMQRDMAFKIVYFFIVFIVATFGLLYAYFQMNKKELEEEE